MFILTAFRSLAKFTNNSYIFFEILLDFRSTQECQYRLDASFLESHINGIQQFLLFCVLHLSLSIILVSFTNVAACINSLFCLL